MLSYNPYLSVHYSCCILPSVGLQNGTALYGQTAFTAAALLHQYRQYLQDVAVIQIHHSQRKLYRLIRKNS